MKVKKFPKNPNFMLIFKHQTKIYIFFQNVLNYIFLFIYIFKEIDKINHLIKFKKKIF